MTVTMDRPEMAPHRDNRLLAACFLCGAVFCATSQDTLMKYVSGAYPVHELLTFRSSIAVPIILAAVLAGPGIRALATRHLWLVLLRSILLFTGFLSFALAFAAMPLADVVTIYFTMPFMVAVLAASMIGERVGLHRWLAIAGGFLGVFIMLQKDADLSDPFSLLAGLTEPAALLAFLSAVSYAVGQLLGRTLGAIVPPAVTAFYQNLLYLFGSLGLALLFTLLPVGENANKSLAFLSRPWIVPPEADYAVLLGIGVLGSFAIPLFASAYKHADASFVAPFEYTSMFWAVLYGILVFSDVPGILTWIGSAIVVSAGLIMLSGDRWRMARTETPA